MEIKILVPENRESDLDNFIKDCENKGFELQNRGGGTMPSFSGYYATLKGKNWKSENNGWIKILSETDLPKEEDEFWVFENNEVTKTKRKIGIDNNDYWWLNIVTHYQPIVKPEPPKF